jgi:hypothetical protein
MSSVASRRSIALPKQLLSPLLVILLATFLASPAATEAAAPTALSFDGTGGYVEVPASLGLGTPLALTAEAWISPAPSPGRRYVLARGGYRLAVEPAGSNVRVLFGLSALGTWRWIASPELATGRWHHVAGTDDGTTTRLFVDGRDVGSQLVVGRLDGLPEPHRIGTADGATDFFAGVVDEVRISDTVRYTGPFAAPTAPFAPDPSTSALWHFDEGVGTSAADASAGANHGTLHGDRAPDAQGDPSVDRRLRQLHRRRRRRQQHDPRVAPRRRHRLAPWHGATVWMNRSRCRCASSSRRFARLSSSTLRRSCSVARSTRCCSSAFRVRSRASASSSSSTSSRVVRPSTACSTARAATARSPVSHTAPRPSDGGGVPPPTLKAEPVPPQPKPDRKHNCDTTRHRSTGW